MTAAHISLCIRNGDLIVSSTESNLAAMQYGHQATCRTSLQIPSQPVLKNPHGILRVTDQPGLVQAIISPKQSMEVPLQTPLPPKTCSSPGSAGKSCWSLDMRVAMLLLTLAGVVILLLLYRLLKLRHRCVGLSLISSNPFLAICTCICFPHISCSVEY